MLRSMEKSRGSQSNGRVWTVPLAAGRTGCGRSSSWVMLCPKPQAGGLEGTGGGQILSAVTDVWGEGLRLP